VIIIGNVIINSEIISQNFVCDIARCHGACCKEGVAGAPLDLEELPTLESFIKNHLRFLSPEAQNYVKCYGAWAYDGQRRPVTPLLADGTCAYAIRTGLTLSCAIEIAFLAGETGFRKPISCHLYPVRIRIKPPYEILEYEHWGVCKNACSPKNTMPLYIFVKDALIRKYGQPFYLLLDTIARTNP